MGKRSLDLFPGDGVVERTRTRSTAKTVEAALAELITPEMVKATIAVYDLTKCENEEACTFHQDCHCTKVAMVAFMKQISVKDFRRAKEIEKVAKAKQDAKEFNEQRRLDRQRMFAERNAARGINPILRGFPQIVDVEERIPSPRRASARGDRTISDDEMGF